MTRVIGGVAGGRRLRAPVGEGTRPTTDRVREALFSALEARLGTLTGLRFLDLYAGSGAVGLEALSRGAQTVTLVDSDRGAARTAAHNAAAVGLEGVSVVSRPVERLLAAGAEAPYDVVFCDPPYPLAEDDLAEVLSLLAERGWLREEAVVVVERSTRSVEPTWPPGLVPTRSKTYGETALWFAAASRRTP